MQLIPQTHYPLLSHNTFGIAVYADYFVHYTDSNRLQQAVAYHNTLCPELPLLHIGAGSNLLFMQDFHGMVLHSGIAGVEVLRREDDAIWVRVGAGMNWDRWVEHSLANGWYGLENLSLIPGEVGASAVQNIGAYGAEAGQFITQVECVDLCDGSLRAFDGTECAYGYRKSVFKEQRARYAVTHVTFRLSLTFRPNLSYRGLSAYFQEQGRDLSTLTADDIRQAVIAVRRQKLPDPEVLGNAGSFFMNPVISTADYERLKATYPQIPSFPVDETQVKVPAAWLIEQSGWKGRNLGPAGVHHIQPLVLVNLGGATGADILRLCTAVQHDVEQKFGIRLRPEVMMIG